VSSATIATFNIHHGAPREGHLRLSRTAATIRSLDAEFVAIQEVDRRVVRSFFRDQMAVLGRLTGMHHHFIPARPWGPLGRYGIGVLSARPPTAVEYLRLPRFDAEQRVAVITSVELSIGRVTIAATHLHYADEAAPAQLDVVLTAMSERPGPYCVLGDFNVESALFAEVCASHGFDVPQGVKSFPASAPRDCIDWVIGRGLTIGALTTVNHMSSDHLPVRTSISATHLVNSS
jgi:endonuclease/exonuclease/phosphatase family metal-dependent hydrolase